MRKLTSIFINVNLLLVSTGLEEKPVWLFRNQLLTFKQIDVLCSELTDICSSFQPEYIVSIDTGGRYVGEKVSKQLNLPHLNIYVCRNIYTLPFLRKLPLVFELAVRWVCFRFTKPVLQRGLSTSANVSITGRRILLVDDAAASGLTLSVAKQVLCSATVKTAVLVDIHGKKADYSVLSGVRHFPWSRTSPEYPIFVAYLNHTNTSTPLS